MTCFPYKRGMTLVELLIVVAIIGLLVQLALPAVLMSREAANATSCRNNLRQIAIAFSLHHDAHKHYPSGGWGYRWAPDPDRGTGKNQPGGWAYCLLPYCEQGPLYSLGSGATAEEKQAANRMRLETPVRLFYCPSRRLPRAYDVAPNIDFVVHPLGSDPLEKGARIDYAANAGGNGFVSWGPGPDSLEQVAEYKFFNPQDGFGIIYPRSQIRMAQLTDGSSKTYLAGEKYLHRKRYKDGLSVGDDQGPFVSDDRDSVRFAGKDDTHRPMQDAEEENSERFGSAHPGGFAMAFCDGSVRTLAYDIDPDVHIRYANRNDEGN